MYGVVFLYVAVILLATAFAKLATVVKWKRKAEHRAENEEGKLNLVFVALSFLTLFLFVALSTSGQDYIPYANWFSTCVDQSYKVIFKQEWIYTFFNRFVRLFTDDFRIFNALYAAVVLLLVYGGLYSLRDKIDFAWAIFIYGLLFYLPIFNIKRICLAAALLFCAVICLFKKRYVLYVLINLLTWKIHTSSLLWLSFFVVYLILQEKLYRRYRYWIVGIFLLLASTLIWTRDIWMKIPLSDRYDHYAEEFDGIGLGVLIKYGVLFALQLRWMYHTEQCRLLDKDARENTLWRIVFTATGISLCFAFAGYVNPVFTRMQTYSTYSFLLFLPYVIKVINERKYSPLTVEKGITGWEKPLTKALILGYVLFFFMDYVSVTLAAEGLATYTTIWGWTIGG